jgi:prepilin-type N-terminal cleavage/methylation domain-containing protein
MRERGFSLIELLIVIAIILIIAAIAIPNLLRSKIAANESAAVGSIHTILVAQTTYSTTYPALGFAANLYTLGSSTSGQASSDNAAILDPLLGCSTLTCQKSGYIFTIANATSTMAPVTSYSIYATPSSAGITGDRGFCSDNSNSILADPNGGQNCTVQPQQ